MNVKKWHTIQVSIKVSQHAAPIVGHFAADCILYEYGKIARNTNLMDFFNLKNWVYHVED